MAEEHLLIKNSECSRHSQNKLVLVKTAALMGLSIVLDATTDLDIECCLAALAKPEDFLNEDPCWTGN
jgi:hypothetical protein